MNNCAVDPRKLYDGFNQFQGARKIVADWSLTKVEDTNYEIIKPYLAGKKVLEVGCGRGYLTALMSQSANVTAFDVSQGVLEYANELGNFGGNVTYFQGSVYAIPFTDAVFDIVVVSEVLEHLSDLDKAMSEINRVLKHGGLVIASVPNSMMYFYPLPLLHSLATRKGRECLAQRLKREEDDGSAQYHRPFMPSQFRNLFRENGFEVVSHRTSMYYFWRWPYIGLIQLGDKYYSALTKVLVKMTIKTTDFLLDNEVPLVKWIGTRQHILARKVV